MSEMNSILDRALALPERDRAALAGRLLDTLDSAADADAQQQWEAEVSRRVVELDCGDVTAIPWSQVREQLREMLDDKGG